MKQRKLSHYIDPKSNCLSIPSEDNIVVFPRLSSYDGILHLSFFNWRRKYSMLSTYVNTVYTKVKYKRFRMLSEYDQFYDGRLKGVVLESNFVTKTKRYDSTKQYLLSTFSN